MKARIFFPRIALIILVALAGSSLANRPVGAEGGTILVDPVSGLVTGEDGLQATFTVALDARPDSAVQIDVESSDPAEGAVSPTKLTLSPGTWDTPETVTVTGVDDGLADGEASYLIILGPAKSNDARFDGQDPPDVSVVNQEADPVEDQQPQANEDSDITLEGNQLTTNVLANDNGLANTPIDLTIDVQPEHGTLDVTEDNQIAYTPEQFFNGQDMYQYEVCDADGDCDQAQVTVVIEAVNSGPVAVDDAHSIALDTGLSIDVLANDYDDDGDTIFLESFDEESEDGGAVTREDNGTPDDTSDDRLFYLPFPGFDGTDTFSYTISDGELSDEALVTVTVGASEQSPVANDDAYTTDLNSPLGVTGSDSVLENDEDINGTGLTAILVSEPANGSLVFNSDGTFDYSPDPDFSGEDAFIYKANDGAYDSNEATVTITVKEINYAPVATNDSYTVGQLETLALDSPGVMDNDGDSNGDAMQAFLVSGPDHGALTLNEDGSLTYIPDEDFVGVDAFVYRANDGSLDSNHATVTIEVLDQLAPTLAWVEPIADGGVYDVGPRTILLQIESSDNVQVMRVEFFRWDAIAGQFVDIAVLEKEPFQVELDTSVLNLQWNQVFAVSYDAAGNESSNEFIWLFREAIIFLPLVTQ